MASSLRADELGLKLPPGFKATLWADHELANDIYAMTIDAYGKVLVTSKGWVKRLEDTKNAGKADKAITIIETPTGGMGLCADGKYQLFFCGDSWFSRYNLWTDKPLDQTDKKFVPLPFTEHGDQRSS